MLDVIPFCVIFSVVFKDIKELHGMFLHCIKSHVFMLSVEFEKLNTWLSV